MKIRLRTYLSEASSGFSLVELMVVISIAAILMSIGIPSFKSLLDAQRMTTTINAFFSAINLTRSHAIGTGKRADLGPRDGKDWNKGWIIFVNKPNDEDNLYSEGDEVIFTHEAVPSDIVITTQLTDNATKYIAYSSTGRTRMNSDPQAPSYGTITFTQGVEIKCIALSSLGRPRVYKPASGVITCTE